MRLELLFFAFLCYDLGTEELLPPGGGGRDYCLLEFKSCGFCC